MMAAVLVIARLCEPSSELHIAEDWFRRTALDDLLGVPEVKVNDDRCYRGLDHMLAHNAIVTRPSVEWSGVISQRSAKVRKQSGKASAT